MKQNLLIVIVGLMCIGILPGCGRVVDWARASVEQGSPIKHELAYARDHIKGIRVYDQFTLKGAFDALWLSDDVRELYVMMHVDRVNGSPQKKEAFLRRQFEENNHFISFFVLAPHELYLGNKQSEWSLLLRIGGDVFQPIEIKSIELPGEYEKIFGKTYTRFKKPYLVKFNAKDINGDALIDMSSAFLQLIFRSIYKEVLLTWYIDQEGQLLQKKKD